MKTNLEKYVELRGRIDRFIELREEYIKVLELEKPSPFGADHRDIEVHEKRIESFRSSVRLLKSFIEGI